eukprot:scaffold4322_cov82-Phaeocystis_antarctica.AAC.1
MPKRRLERAREHHLTEALQAPPEASTAHERGARGANLQSHICMAPRGGAGGPSGFRRSAQAGEILGSER